MASCDVQAVRSQVQLASGSEGNTDTVEISDVEIKGKLQPTKIPRPIPGLYGNIAKPRKYTSCSVRRNKSSISIIRGDFEDSGVQLDYPEETAENLHVYSSNPELQCQWEGTESQLKLRMEEEQTLLVLQRAVAEMEEDIEKHSTQDYLEVEPEIQPQMEEAVECLSSSSDLEIAEYDFGTEKGRERKMVRVEQLFAAEHDIELLQKLLQTGNEESDAHDPPEDSPILLTSVFPKLEEVEGLVAQPSDEQLIKAEKCSFGNTIGVICGRSLRSLSYSILICGMAVSMIYWFKHI